MFLIYFFLSIPIRDQKLPKKRDHKGPQTIPLDGNIQFRYPVKISFARIRIP